MKRILLAVAALAVLSACAGYQPPATLAYGPPSKFTGTYVGNSSFTGPIDRCEASFGVKVTVAENGQWWTGKAGNYHGKIGDDGTLSASWGSYILVGHIADDAETGRYDIKSRSCTWHTALTKVH